MSDKQIEKTAVEIWQLAAARLKPDNALAGGLCSAGRVVGHDQNIIIISYPSDLILKRVQRFRRQIVAALRDVNSHYLDVVFFVE